jgi:pilus assembly protein CpaB
VRLKVVMMLPAAAVLGFIAVQAGRHWVDRQVNEKLREADARALAPAPAATFGTIVVAAAPLRFGVELNPGALREIPWPQGQMPKGAFAKISDLFTEKAKRVVIFPMEDNEPVLAAKITGPGQRANLAAVLDEGMKAVTVRVDDVVGVAGFVLPGDRVDVLLTRSREKVEAFSDIILQNLKVLAIDQLNDDRANKPAIARTVTLEVATEQAQRLIVAQHVGSLTLVLRPAGENAVEANQRVTAADLANPLGRSPRPAADEDSPVASFGQPGVTVGVIRKTARQEYNVPATRRE